MADTVRHTHSSIIFAVRACDVSEDAADLVAIGGDTSVDVLQVVSLFTLRLKKSMIFLIQLTVLCQGPSATRIIASFYIGSRITALAWSSRSISPTSSEDWSVE